MNNKSINNNIFVFYLINFIFGTFLYIITSAISIPVFIIILSILTISLVRLLDQGMEIIKYINLSIFIFYIVMLITYYGWILATGTPYYTGGSDDYSFETIARIYYNNGWFNFTTGHGYSTNTRFYIFIISILYSFGNIFGGYHTFLPRILNGYFEIFIMILVYLLMKERYNCNFSIIKKALLLLALNPYYKFINSHVFRDTLSLLLVILIIYLFHKVQNKGNIILKILWIICICFLIFISYFLRTQLLLINIASMFIMIFKFNNNSRNYLKALFLILIISTFLFIDYKLNIIGFFQTNAQYKDYVVGNSPGFSSIIMKLPLFPFGALIRIIYAFMTPFPSFISLFQNSNNFLIDTIYLICFLYVIWQVSNTISIAKGFISNKECGVMWLFFISLFAVVTYTFRHIILSFPWLSICYSLGESNKINEENSKSNIQITKIILFILFMAFISFYTILKLI